MAVVPESVHHLPDGTGVLLRSATTADAVAFTQYVVDIFSTSQYLITQADEFRSDVSRQREWILGLRENPEGLLLLAIAGGRIVGNIDFRGHQNRRRIGHRGSFGMGVREDWRGRGVGRLLLSTMIKWTQRPESRIEKIELGVLSENGPALALYRSLGFKEEGRIQKSVKLREGVYLDEVMMGLDLTRAL